MVNNLLSHELIHVIINEKYPSGDFSYLETLDYISFHEGFAHLLSYKEGIEHYMPNDIYKTRFMDAKEKLVLAINETSPESQELCLRESNTGDYWDKFGAISSMLYLMKHVDSLKEIYEAGWRGYTKTLIDFAWE